MGLWLVQLYDPDELAKLEEKHLDILKSRIRKELASNPTILRALHEALDPIYESFKSKAPR